MSDFPIIIRSYVSDDLHYIADSWSKTLHLAMPFCYIPRDLYFNRQLQLIRSIIAHPSVLTLVACLAEDPSIIIGYLVYEFVGASSQLKTLVVHWAETKSAFRRQHVLTTLLNAVEPLWRKKLIIITQPSKVFTLMRRQFYLQYDPFLLSNFYQGKTNEA